MEKLKSKNAGKLTGEKASSEQLPSRTEIEKSQLKSKVADPQVKPSRYSQRRSFTSAYKAKILDAYNACPDTESRGSLLRQEGLYHSQICTWRNLQSAQKIKSSKPKKFGKTLIRVDHLVRENEQLKKKLAQAEAIIDLQKKVAELLGNHILPHGTIVVNS